MLKKLKEILEENTGITDINITSKTNLKNDLGLNSFDLAQLVCNVEDEFNIEIPDDALKTIRTVGDVIAFIEKQWFIISEKYNGKVLSLL